MYPCLLITLALLCWGVVCGYEHKICLMTTFRLMANTSLCNLVEWIEYHLLLGVDHFVLRNDCSVDSAAVEKATARYVSAGLLSLDRSPPEDCARTDSRRIYEEMSAKYGVLQKCDWLSIVDNDEYISFADSVYTSSLLPLRSYVGRLEVPFSRMLWFVVGNENFEARPNGTIIGNFLHGAMDKPHYLKTLVKTSVVLQFTNAHFPKLLPQYDNRFVALRASSNGPYQEVYDAGDASNATLLSWRSFIEANALHRFEHTIARARQANSTYSDTSRRPREMRPPYDIFLKHFKYLSWQEYSEQRAATKTLANGRKNYWGGKQGRQQWELGRPASRHFLMGKTFTARMASLLAAKLRGHCIDVASGNKCCALWK